MTGAEIAAVRVALEMSQVTFSRLVGVHHMTVSKWERGRASPSTFHTMLIDVARRALANDPDIPHALREARATKTPGAQLALLFRASRLAP